MGELQCHRFLRSDILCDAIHSPKFSITDLPFTYQAKPSGIPFSSHNFKFFIKHPPCPYSLIKKPSEPRFIFFTFKKVNPLFKGRGKTGACFKNLVMQRRPS